MEVSLRAIAHNQSQTARVGIKPVDTVISGLWIVFLKTICRRRGSRINEDRILPNLPVLWNTPFFLRLYHDVSLIYLNRLETAFPAGNSAFLALREDIDSLSKYLILFQRELIRRHGLNVTDFFESDKFIADLLPTASHRFGGSLTARFIQHRSGIFFYHPSAGMSMRSARGNAKSCCWIPERIGYWPRQNMEHAWDTRQTTRLKFCRTGCRSPFIVVYTRTMDLPFRTQEIKGVA